VKGKCAPESAEGAEARIGSMVSRCKRLINVVKLERAESARIRPEPKGNGVGTGTVLLSCHGQTGSFPALPANRADLTCRVTHPKRGKPVALPEQGRQTVRCAVGAAGRRRWKKRKPACNGRDRAATSRHTHCESRQTSTGSFLTREFAELAQAGKQMEAL
jgi:hypothetical protein